MTEVIRQIFPILTKRVKNNKIIIIRGPRRSGKTYLLSQIKRYLLRINEVSPQQIISYNGDDDIDRMLWEENARPELDKLLLKGKSHHIYVFFDEFQKIKRLSEKIKFIADSPSQKRIKFFLTGSSTLSISQKTSESLLGRTETYTLFPFSFTESLQITRKNILKDKGSIQNTINSFTQKPTKKTFDTLVQEAFFWEKDYQLKNQLINSLLYGGYPEAILNSKEAFWLLKQIKDAYVEKDILKEFKITNWEDYEKTMKYLSLSIGQLFNRQNYSREIGIAQETLKKFSNILRSTYMIDFLPVYRTNKISSLRSSQKPYFMDLGMRNLLANTFTKDVLIKEEGLIKENFIFVQLYKNIAYRPFSLGSKLYFWRNEDKNEIDFILEQNREIIPIEVKNRFDIDKGFYIFVDKMKLKKAIIISDRFSYQKKNNLEFFSIPIEVFALLI